MPVYIETSAQLAASATDENVIKDKRYRQSPRPRVLKAVTGYTRENTPAENDMRMTVLVGEFEVAKFHLGLARTTGGAVQAEDWLPVGYPVAPNETVTVKIENLDSGGAHSAQFGLAFDGY